MVVADTANGNNHATVKVGGEMCPTVANTQPSVATFGLDNPADRAFYIWFFG